MKLLNRKMLNCIIQAFFLISMEERKETKEGLIHTPEDKGGEEGRTRSYM